MKKNVAVICAVGLPGLVAVILGFVGEGTKSQSFVKYDGVNCVYRATPALGCGVVGALFLLTAQIVVSSVTGCCGCCRTRRMPSETKRAAAVVMSVVSWILLIIAVGMFFAGAVWNTAAKRQPEKTGSSSSGQQLAECYVLKGGIFSAASVLSLVVVAFGITSYFLLQPSAPLEETMQQQRQPGIAMGQPAYFQPEQRGYPAGAAWP